MKSKQKGRLLLVKVCITRITRKQGSQLKGRTYSCVAEYISVLNPSEPSRTQVRYREREKDVCGYNNSLRIVISFFVVSVSS